MSVVLAAVGASIFLLLGFAHAVFSLQSRPDGGPLMPLDLGVRDAMHVVGGLGMAPEVESSLYRGWIGFNLSHSLGIVAIAGVLLAQIVSDFGDAVGQAPFLVLVAVAPAAYCVLAVKYWFDKPRDAIAIATIFLWAGVVMELL